MLCQRNEFATTVLPIDARLSHGDFDEILAFHAPEQVLRIPHRQLAVGRELGG